MIPVFAGIFFTVIVSLYYAIYARQQVLDTTITDTAAMIASFPQVRKMVETGQTEPDVIDSLRRFEKSFSQVDVLVVCDTDSIRYYHTTPERIGEKFIGGDQADILAGHEPYISAAVGTLGPQRRAFHAILDDEGKIVGFVMASVLNSNIDQLRARIIMTFFLILITLTAIGIITSSAFRYQLQKTLLGYNPEEFVTLYVERNDVLNVLEEGIFAINNNGEIILMNHSAKRMLDLPTDTNTEGHLLTEYYPNTQLPVTLRTGRAEYNINFTINNKNIISSRIPIRSNNQIIGAVSIFRNKTEVTKLAEELTGANYMVDTLRAFNHEFVNKLHVIMGLLEIGEVQEAKNYIMNTSLVSGKAVSDIHQRVPISSLAALLIGKLVRASELGITLTLKNDSYFYPKETYLPSDCYITLVGNLLENAIDELNHGDYPVKQIELGIYSEEGHTTIICDDTGGGIPEDILFSIYDRHTTTKGPGHGSGFYLMKQIVDRYEGTFHIDTEIGEGTSIEIILPI